MMSCCAISNSSSIGETSSGLGLDEEHRQYIGPQGCIILQQWQTIMAVI